MKIVFLNAWAGKLTKEINQFVLDHASSTDIFCFQESCLNKKSPILFQSILTDFNLISANKYVNKVNFFRQATFIKKNLSLLKQSSIGDQDNNQIGLGLFSQIKANSQIINLCNFHGHARPGHKQDTPARLLQSQLIIDFFKDLSSPKIIGGDFNLDLNTESVKVFEKNGYKNLIKEFNIPTTRNRLSWEKYDNRQLFADHLFVSPDIKITNFSVIQNEISDHLPMILEFEI